MMKSFLLVSAYMFLSASCIAQLSVNASLGYALPSGGQTLGTGVDYQSSNSYLEQSLFRSFGQGIQAHAGAKYLLSESLGLDVQIGFLSNDFLANSFEDDDDLETIRYETTQISLSPSLVIQTPGEGAKVYARFGVVVPILTSITEQVDDIRKDYFSGGENRDYLVASEATWKTSSGLGFQGGLGVLVPVGPFQIFAEANIQNLSLRAMSRTITFYEDDGDDQLREITTATKETIFLREITEDNNRWGNSNFDSDDPSEEVAPSFIFNNASLRIGISIPLSGD